MGLLAFVLPLSTDMYLPAFPQLVADLHATPAGAQLSIQVGCAALAALALRIRGVDTVTGPALKVTPRQPQARCLALVDGGHR